METVAQLVERQIFSLAIINTGQAELTSNMGFWWLLVRVRPVSLKAIPSSKDKSRTSSKIVLINEAVAQLVEQRKVL